LSEFRNPAQALVMFSGGQTHREVGRISEAESYVNAARYLGLRNYRNAAVEEFARDSYENVLFSLCRFKQLVGKYPEKFIVIGFEFKRERFENEHRQAIRFPADKFEYRGVPEPSLGSIAEQIQMERTETIPQFRDDPYGCKPPLATKREERNPFHQQHFYESSCPEMAGLFQACGSEIYAGPLPWGR